MRVLGVLMALCMVLAACGRDDGNDAENSASSTTPSLAPEPPPADVETGLDALEGEPAPADLTGVVCAPGDDGEWVATGKIDNPTKADASYQVTVVLGAAGADDTEARTKQIGVVKAGKSKSFAYEEMPAVDEETPCFVQLLRD